MLGICNNNQRRNVGGTRMSGLSIHALIRKVDLLTLKLFLVAIEEKQIGRAAARENIVPSAATKRIQDLEEIAELQLLERNPKGVVPTPAGQVLARHIRMMFESLDDMRREMSEYTAGVRGQVRISAIGTTIVQFLAREISEFSRNFPFVDVELHEDTNPNVVRALVAGNVDIAVYVATEDLVTDGIDSREYRTDRLVAIVPRGHSLCDKSSVSMRDFIGQNFIGILPSGTMMTWLRNAAKQIGSTFEPRYNVNSVDTARSLVRSGLGMTILPECMLALEDSERTVVIPIAEPWALRHFQIATQRGKSITAAVQALIKQLTDQPSSATGALGSAERDAPNTAA
jgi:DNA-binding transcriptional LysR family regulator